MMIYKKKYQESSETIRNASHVNGSIRLICSFSPDDFFPDWLAGLIDADGGFYISKAGYVSCEITMHTREIETLYYVAQRCGGKVSPRKNSDSVRWRLHNRKGMEKLYQIINGKLRTRSKQEQWKAACHALDKPFQSTPPLTQDNAWLSGFFCGDGHFNINSANFQPSIGLGQKDAQILNQIASLWGGSIYYDKSWHGWVWWVSAKRQLEPIITYLNAYPLQNPYKITRLQLFSKYLRLYVRGDHLDSAKKDHLQKDIRSFQLRDEDIVQKKAS
jgi:LAGLIDADG endonuclease